MNKKHFFEKDFAVQVDEHQSSVGDYKDNSARQRIKFAPNCRWLIHCNMTVYGIVDTRDIMGAISAISNAYLEDCSFKVLTEKGRLGRLELDVTKNKEKYLTSVSIKLPVGDCQNTASLVAAGLKMVEKVGSYKAISSIEQIEDNDISIKTRLLRESKIIRNSKFKSYIPLESGEAANNLIEALRLSLTQSNKPKSVEVTQGINIGSDFATSTAVYVVEGVADITRLGSFGIHNVISCNGTEVPDIVFEKIDGKTVTLLSDADRGGNQILQKFKTKLGNTFYVIDLPHLCTIEKIDKINFFKLIKGKHLP